MLTLSNEHVDQVLEIYLALHGSFSCSSSSILAPSHHFMALSTRSRLACAVRTALWTRDLNKLTNE